MRFAGVATQRTRNWLCLTKVCHVSDAKLSIDVNLFSRAKFFSAVWSMFQCPSGQGEGKQPLTSVCTGGG